MTRLPFLYFLLCATFSLFAVSCDDTSNTAPAPPEDTNSTSDGVEDTANNMTPNHGPLAFESPESCGGCHVTHYEEWRSSMHAYAIKDPVFLGMLEKGIKDTSGKLDQFCVQCHAPMAIPLPIEEVDGVFKMTIDQNDPRVSEGVQCTTCHRIDQVQGTQNAQFTISTTTYFGPTGSAAANAVHPMEASPFFNDPAQKSLLCGSCHDVLNPKGARLEATFSEWYSNAYNDPSNPENHRTCQDCHMPAYMGRSTPDSPETVMHSHRFVGVDQALIPGFPGKEIQAAQVRALLQDCSELTLEYNGIESSAEGSHAVFIVTVKNINNGHNLPSGSTADRQVWVHLRILDESGQLVYESGMLDPAGDLMDGVEGHSATPDGDPQLLAFGQFLFDESGAHVNFPWEASQFTDGLIPPGQTAWRDYPVEADALRGQTVTLEATLKYRTFPPFLIRKLAGEGFLDAEALDEIPIIEMETLSETFNIAP